MIGVAAAAVVGFLGTWLLISLGPTTAGLLVAFLAAVYLALDVLRILARHTHKRHEGRQL